LSPASPQTPGLALVVAVPPGRVVASDILRLFTQELDSATTLHVNSISHLKKTEFRNAVLALFRRGFDRRVHGRRRPSPVRGCQDFHKPDEPHFAHLSEASGHHCLAAKDVQFNFQRVEGDGPKVSARFKRDTATAASPHSCRHSRPVSATEAADFGGIGTAYRHVFTVAYIGLDRAEILGVLSTNSLAGSARLP
jgi:hypothetical protein